MAKFSIKSNLIDGSSTKRFKSVELAAEWVRSMEDFGEDGRRTWGVQGEFGTHEFVGFTWEDVKAVWRMAAKLVIVECPEWGGFEWDYDRGESVQMWAHRFTVKIECPSDETGWVGIVDYDVKAVQGRFQVEAIEYSGWDDFATVRIGTYRSMGEAADACLRHYAAPKADPSFVNDAFWSHQAERCSAAMQVAADGWKDLPF